MEVEHWQKLCHFRPYLFGHMFIARTDHNSLNWLHNFRDPKGQVAHWLNTIFKVIHRPGSQHSNADALSWQPCRQHGCRGQNEKETATHTQLEEDDDVTEVATISTSDSWASSWSVDELKSSQASCWYHTEPDDQLVGSPQNPCHPTSQKVAVLNYNPCGHNGNICSWKIAFSIVVGKISLASDFTRDCSLFSHSSWWQMYWLSCMMILQVGIKKTLERVCTRFHWVGQRWDVEEWCKACEICAARRPNQNQPKEPKKHKSPLQIEPATYPLEHSIAMDILGPLPKTQCGNKYILVIGDYFTKWKDVYPMRNMEATTVANILFQEFISRFGVPKYLHTDQGRNFEAGLIKRDLLTSGYQEDQNQPLSPPVRWNDRKI